MKKRLRSIPFISLYVAAISAVVLSFGREMWGSSLWYPLAVGLTAAMAIIPLRFLFEQKLLDRCSSDWYRIIFFFFFGLVPFAGIPFLGSEDAVLIVGLVIITGIFLWAAFATLFQLPGFRPPIQAHECHKCRYNLTSNTSGICPECGTPITAKV